MECLFDDDGRETCDVDASDSNHTKEGTIETENGPERVLFIGSSLDDTK